MQRTERSCWGKVRWRLGHLPVALRDQHGPETHSTTEAALRQRWVPRGALQQFRRGPVHANSPHARMSHSSRPCTRCVCDELVLLLRQDLFQEAPVSPVLADQGGVVSLSGAPGNPVPTPVTAGHP